MKTIFYNFVINHLISPESIEGETISFVSPHFPSTRDNEDFIKGELAIKLLEDQDVPEETIKNCLELSCALLNQAYFQTKLERLPSSFYLCLNATAYCTHTLKNPEKIEKIFNKSLQLMSQYDHWFNHAQSLFMRSLKAGDIIDKFIYSWITFECLYGCLYEARGHLKGIKCLIGNNIPESLIREEIVRTHIIKFNYLASLSLIDKRNKINWSEKLRISLNSNNIDDIIINGISAIAMIRNSIFHGNTLDRNHEAGECFFPLNHLNSEILKNIIFFNRAHYAPDQNCLGN